MGEDYVLFVCLFVLKKEQRGGGGGGREIEKRGDGQNKTRQNLQLLLGKVWDQPTCQSLHHLAFPIIISRTSPQLGL